MQGRVQKGCDEWWGGPVVLWSGNLLGLKSKVLRHARYRCDGEALRMEITFDPGLLDFLFLKFTFDLCVDGGRIARCRSLEVQFQ